MSVIKEINELHISTKTILVSLVIIIPFWYLSLFILNRQFVNSNQIHIPIIVAFCLSVCYYILNFISTLLFSETQEGDKNQPLVDKIAFLTTMTCIVSIFWISTVLFIGYYYDWKFISMTKITFLISFIHFVLFLGIRLSIKKNKK